MNFLYSLILILIFAVPFNSLAQSSNTKVLKPKNAETNVKTIISGKSKNYYPLKFGDPTIISLKGPGKLKIITRVQFTSGKNQFLDYKIYYRIDGTFKNEVDFDNVKRSETAKYNIKSLGVPGVGKNIILEFGLGDHTLEIWSAMKFPNVAARYLFTKTKELKIKWVSLSPRYPKEPVDLVSSEDVIPYFRFSKTKPLKVKITGPTILRVLNRVENHYYMKGMINYRLQVIEDGNIKNTYLFCSARSEVTSYKKEEDKIPGKAKEIVINVPRGTHFYEIIPLDKDKKTILGRILFPKNDIKLEE